MSFLGRLREFGVRTEENGFVNPGHAVAREFYGGRVHTTKLIVTSSLPAIVGGTNLAVGRLLYTFPAGTIVTLGAYINLAITQTEGNINADTPDGGLGTTIASGANTVLSATAAFENLLTGQTFNNCTGTKEVAGVTTSLAIQAADNHTVYFNVADAWAAGGDAAALLTGVAVINWVFLG